MNRLRLAEPHFISIALLRVKSKFSYGLLCFVCMLLWVGNQSAFASGPLVDGDLQLLGPSAHQKIAFHVSGPSPQPVELQLRWTASPLVDGQKSFVHILVDGQIRSTRSIADLAKAAWRIQLRPLPPGNRELSIRTNLRGKADDCMPMPDSLWLTLLESSRISGAGRSQGMRTPAPLAVRDIVRHWTSRAATPNANAALENRHVRLIHDLTWNAGAAVSWMQAQFFLLSRGLLPLAEQREAPTAQSAPSVNAALILRSWEGLEPDHPARKRWKEVQDTLYVLYTPAPMQLEIITRAPQHAQLALDLLADDAKREVCNQALCSVSSSTLLTNTISPPSPPGPGPQLWRMAIGDQPRGWQAHGVGTHRLRQVWLRPASMQFHSDVRMHLAARVSQVEHLDAEHSSLTLRINDQPVATYSLAHWKSSHAKVRIPASMWNENVWVMDFEVRLVARSTKRCSFSSPDDLWVVIDPETQIEAQFKQTDAASISGFWQRAFERNTIHLNWPMSSVGLPTDRQITAFAPLLQAYVSTLPKSNAGRFEFVNSSTCTQAACIILHSGIERDASSSSVFTWKNVLKTRAKSAQNLPDLSSINSAVMVWLPSEGSMPEQLHIGLGPTQSFAIPAPQWASLNGSIAIYADQWQVFADESSYQAALLSTPPSSGGNVSNQQGRLRWINLIWALGSILILAGAALMYWRKQRRPDPKTWEVQ
jgi:hypothetical protein